MQPLIRKAIVLVLPFGPGGATDNVMRTMAEKASRQLGQPIVIENRPGASGMLGANHVAKASSDGYTIAIAPDPIFVIPYLQKAQFDPATDFTYIIQLSGYALGVAASTAAQFKTWKDVVEQARRKPGEISFGTTGVNGTMHLTMEEISRRLNIQLNHVAFKGEGEIINALMGGHIDLAVTAGSIAPMVQSGKARSLLMWTSDRIAQWPDVPTLKDIGIDKVATAPFGLIGPKNLNADVAIQLHDAFKAALDDRQLQELLLSLNQVPSYLNGADYRQYAFDKISASKLVFSSQKKST